MVIVKKVETQQELEDAYRIRMDVFVKEQHVPEEEEIDEYEPKATHFVIYEDSEVIGAGRLRYLNEYGKIERICIAKTFRSKGIGQLLMNAIEDEIKQNHFLKAKLNAQTQAKSFYSRLGYEIVSGEFLDAGIPHVTMEKTLI